MSVIYVLIPIAILLTALGIYLFFWAVKTEQFDDLEKQGLSILFDDESKISTELIDNPESVSSPEHTSSPEHRNSPELKTPKKTTSNSDQAQQ